MEHAPNVEFLDYVPRDFFTSDSIEARQLQKAAHPEEADPADKALEFQ